MASTISTRLMISGAAVTSDPIAVDYVSNPTVTAPAIESASVDITPAGVEILTTGATPTRTFLYVKNTGSVSQSYITVGFDCAETATNFIRLNLGEFCYLPLVPSQTVTLDCPATVTGHAEYGYFTAV